MPEVAVNCRYPGCLADVPQRGGRGRPRIYCAEHGDKASSKRAVRFAKLLATFPCCADAKRVNPRARKCAQHKGWSRVAYGDRRRRGTVRDLREFTRMLEEWGSVPGEPRGWRYVYGDGLIIESDEDRRLHKIADEFIAANSATLHEGDESLRLVALCLAGWFSGLLRSLRRSYGLWYLAY